MKQLCSSLPIHSEYIKIQQKFTISSSYLQLSPVLSRWTLISLYHDRFRNVYKFSQEPWELKLSIYGLSPKTRSMLNLSQKHPLVKKLRILEDSGPDCSFLIIPSALVTSILKCILSASVMSDS